MTDVNGGTVPDLKVSDKPGFMGPLAILTAITVGSAIAIEFGLVSVLLIFWILRSESEEVAVEIGHLPLYCLVFMLLSAVAAAAMYSLMKVLPWRWHAQAAMWGLVLAIGTWFTVFR